MRFLRLIILFFIVACVVPTPRAFAQDKVAARTGMHEGYARLVFEWPSKPEYSLSKDGNNLKIRFARAASLDRTGGEGVSGSNIRALEILSSSSEPLQVSVAIPAGSRFRDFIVGNKMILDVYDSPDAGQTRGTSKTGTKKAKEEPDAQNQTALDTPEDAPQQETSPEEAPETAKPAAAQTPEGKNADLVEKAEAGIKDTTGAAAGDFSLHAAEKANPVPVQKVETTQVAAPQFEPHAITLTSTTSNGMVAFKRNGMLWIIIDSAELPSGPQVSGPQKDRLPPLVKVSLPDATAYHMDLPEGMNVYGEGGGLSWRIALTPDSRKTSPVLPSGEGGRLEWPLKDMRKIITVTDPLAGDRMIVVTSPVAKQYTGAPRSFVQLDTLESVIGLAYVPKSDDVSVEKTFDAVRVGRPDGLALSNNSDLMPERIRQQMEEPPEPVVDDPKNVAPVTAHQHEAKTENATEDQARTSAKEPEQPDITSEIAAALADEPAVKVDDLARAAGEKPVGNNIYNFSRWEMGGPALLGRNMHALMAEMSNKGEGISAEDIMTMAKLNVANDRGAEALGLLRMALRKVPELEDNPEFNALRGAALALSYKYDEAIIDFTREGVKKFDDIKYWTAYALAGLEDWKQAIAILPKDLDMVKSYPAEIRMPMVLTFAEIALRGGNVPLANAMLNILRSDLAKLPLPYASYWNYLAGEAARQNGQPDKAIEYWDPMVKGGKDDLFRAKAGLSLTKLLLDQKKIKPAEAVNTLEGLRYAWRGDELETLVNFRLGQVYIDNGDFLKGLTVLRNASTLSPGSDLNKEVKDYMLRTFRDIFSNNRLRKISPLEAISLYEEFKDLAPQGEESDRYVERLAERLVDAELLGRAASLLEYQVNNRLQGDKKADIAIRLAAIRLLDGNPDGALRSLEIAQDVLDRLSGVKPVADAQNQTGASTRTPNAEKSSEHSRPDPEKQRQVHLLKARALSMKKETDKAMGILGDMRLDADVNRLRADIAWSAGRWEEAALALNDLVTSEDISARRPLTDYQRDLILNRAIALNLSGNRVALANLRERYNGQMKDTTKGQMFEIVTRPRRPDMIGSRQAIDSMISEIDLFQGFIDGYAKMESGSARAPATVTETQTPAASAPSADNTVTP